MGEREKGREEDRGKNHALGKDPLAFLRNDHYLANESSAGSRVLPRGHPAGLPTLSLSQCTEARIIT